MNHLHKNYKYNKEHSNEVLKIISLLLLISPDLFQSLLFLYRLEGLPQQLILPINNIADLYKITLLQEHNDKAFFLFHSLVLWLKSFPLIKKRNLQELGQPAHDPFMMSFTI